MHGPGSGRRIREKHRWSRLGAAMGTTPGGCCLAASSRGPHGPPVAETRFEPRRRAARSGLEPGPYDIFVAANAGALPWNLMTANTPSTRNNASTKSCAIRNGGSDCVGAIPFSAGTFWNDCAIRTKTFR